MLLENPGPVSESVANRRQQLFDSPRMIAKMTKFLKPQDGKLVSPCLTIFRTLVHIVAAMSCTCNTNTLEDLTQRI